MFRFFTVVLFFAVCTVHAQNEVAAVTSGEPKQTQQSPIGKTTKSPPISEIVRIDQSNVFFLDTMGQVGVAKFSPELELVAWDYYSMFQWQEARHIAVGRDLSIVSGSPNELTQAFDTDKDGRLDFFQDMISDWPGKAEGSTISCGPVADQYGRLLFAVAPKAGAAVSISTLFAWNPGGQSLTSLATSKLPIAEMAISKSGMLAAWIQMPSYGDGYFMALAKVPAFDPRKPDNQPGNPPELKPGLIIPRSMTGFEPIGQFCFAYEDDREKLYITCPSANRIIEMIPEETDGNWGGSITVLDSFDEPVYAIEPMGEGKVLLGGKAGFAPLKNTSNSFRFRDLRIVPDALEINFTKPVDRIKATEEGAGVQLAIIPLEGELEPFDAPRPIVESDGLTVVLQLPKLPGKAIIKVDAPGLTSEEGEPIVFPSMYYQVD